MNMRNRILAVALIVGLVFVVLVHGCGGKTIDIAQIQKDTPFAIIIPTYIPEKLGSDYTFQIKGPIEDPVLHSIEVDINYANQATKIYISEQSHMSVMIPNEELEPVYYEIAGTKVLRQKTGLITSTGEVEGISFDWNPSGLTFSVEIFNISEEEGIIPCQSASVWIQGGAQARSTVP